MKKSSGKKEKNSDELVSKPFAALKGVQAKAAAPREEPAPKPAPRPVAAEIDDAALFLRAVSDVRRLHPQPAKKPRPSGEVPAAPEKDDAEQRVFLDAVRRLKLDVTFVDKLPEESAGAQRGQAANRLRQLKKGTLRVDLELDLHGLTKDEALESLARFVAGAYNRGQQAVLVITGKGNNSPGEPVLQGAVVSWLRDKGRGMVAEFAPAPRVMGGSGALVVFLKVREKQKP